MTFPQTRLTLIQRLASGGREEDWRCFLKDYWGPVCRFSLRWGARDLDDAEDVVSQTFEVLLEKRLLVSWASNRSAKLRTLLCTVVRNILSHRRRVEARREQLLREMAEEIDRASRAQDDEVDAFYAAWVEDVVQRSVESLAAEYCGKGQGDYLRVLYSRLCERLSVAKVAEALQLRPTTVVNYFRHARKRLSEKMEDMVRRQVERYSPPDEAKSEFDAEWQQVGKYLAASGGLEEAVGRVYDLLDPVRAKDRREAALTRAVTRLTSVIPTHPDATSSQKTP
jgi:RNA polymerase sigma factor (sigma-70 family)